MDDGEIVLIGCYTPHSGGGRGEGIFAAVRHPRTGALVPAGVLARTPSPSYLAWHPTLPVVYAANELPEGAVSAWRFTEGRVEAAGRASTGGDSPCHLAVTPDGRYLVTANYGSGSIAVHRLDDLGAIEERTDLLAHDGHGPDADRQAGPHAHMISPTPRRTPSAEPGSRTDPRTVAEFGALAAAEHRAGGQSAGAESALTAHVGAKGDGEPEVEAGTGVGSGLAVDVGTLGGSESGAGVGSGLAGDVGASGGSESGVGVGSGLSGSGSATGVGSGLAGDVGASGGSESGAGVGSGLSGTESGAGVGSGLAGNVRAPGDGEPGVEAGAGVGSDPRGGEDTGSGWGGDGGAIDGLLAVDLGTDAIYPYAIDHGRLLPTGHRIHLRRGTGPRHLARHPDGRRIYVAGELGGTVTVFEIGERGWHERQRVPASAREGQCLPSAIAVRPDGRFLYVANRGVDTVSVFAVEAHDEPPAAVAEVDCNGSWPRDFALIGDHLYVANERSHTVAIFAVDGDSGIPSPCGDPVSFSSPTCVLAAPPSAIANIRKFLAG